MGMLCICVSIIACFDVHQAFCRVFVGICGKVHFDK
jgi:hypothetical protein